jgi:hypothetical protein
MSRSISVALTAIFVLSPLASAQYYPPSQAPSDPGALVNSWYERFLHREADVGSQAWVQYLRSGQSPESVLSGILASNEYYIVSGGRPASYIQRLYSELVGRPPSPAEFGYWMRQLRFSNRHEVAYKLLMRHPQNWSAPPSGGTPGGYGFDPGYYPDTSSPPSPYSAAPYFGGRYGPSYEYRRPTRGFPYSPGR